MLWITFCGHGRCIGVTNDKAGVQFNNSQGRREAAGGHGTISPNPPWSAALAIWPFAIRVSHPDRPLRRLAGLADGIPRHCWRQRYPTQLKHSRPRREQDHRRDRNHCDQKDFHGPIIKRPLVDARQDRHYYRASVFSAPALVRRITRSQPGIAEFSFPRRW